MEQRLIDIETKLAFAEQTIEDLSSELYRHQKKIDQLEMAFKQLRPYLEKLSAHSGPVKLEDEIPPHY